MNISGIPINFSNISWDSLYSDLCPFEPEVSLNYNFHIILNFVLTLFLFLDVRYSIQDRFFSHKRAVRNQKLLLVMLAVYNTIFLLNQFVLIPIFEYLRMVYGI